MNRIRRFWRWPLVACAAVTCLLAAQSPAQDPPSAAASVAASSPIAPRFGRCADRNVVGQDPFTSATAPWGAATLQNVARLLDEPDQPSTPPAQAETGWLPPVDDRTRNVLACDLLCGCRDLPNEVPPKSRAGVDRPAAAGLRQPPVAGCGAPPEAAKLAQPAPLEADVLPGIQSAADESR